MEELISYVRIYQDKKICQTPILEALNSSFDFIKSRQQRTP